MSYLRNNIQVRQWKESSNFFLLFVKKNGILKIKMQEIKQWIEQVAPLFSFILLPHSQEPLSAKCPGLILLHPYTTKIDPQNLLEGPYKKKSQRKNFLKLKLVEHILSAWSVKSCLF